VKPLKVLVLMHEDLVPPDSVNGLSIQDVAAFKTEYDVVKTLKRLGHEAKALGVSTDLGAIRTALFEFQPDIAFNLLEEFHGVPVYEQHVVAYLELSRQAYTGCNPRGLMLAHDKALAKKILSYHRIRVPDFVVFPRERRFRRPARLKFPLLVKSTTLEGSEGIAQASVVRDDDKLKERVEFIHSQIGTDALVEEYIEGRELYVAMLGNRRVRTLPIWELLFTDWPEGAPRIATARVKWNLAYQKERGIVSRAAKDLPEGSEERIRRLCRRIYRVLGLSGYARIDLRLTAEGKVYVLEANPNPLIAKGEDFADAARAAGVSYGRLLQRILALGLGYRAEWMG
jgi:D-alanine-D-alanine ligase